MRSPGSERAAPVVEDIQLERPCPGVHGATLGTALGRQADVQTVRACPERRGLRADHELDPVEGPYGTRVGAPGRGVTDLPGGARGPVDRAPTGDGHAGDDTWNDG